MIANISITSEESKTRVSESNQRKASRSSAWCDFSSVRTEESSGQSCFVLLYIAHQRLGGELLFL